MGSRADVDFYRAFIGDMKQAVGKAMSEVKFGDGVDVTKINSHTPFLTAYVADVAKKATDSLRRSTGDSTASSTRPRATPRWSRCRCSATAERPASKRAALVLPSDRW